MKPKSKLLVIIINNLSALFTQNNFRRQFCLASLIGLLIESEEHIKKDERIEQFKQREELWIGAIRNDEAINRMSGEEDELKHLNLRDVLLPPQIRPHLRPNRRQAIVSVHNGVDSGVNQRYQDDIAARDELKANVASERHERMVKDVKRRHLVIIFAHHEEERVQKVDELGEKVEPPAVDLDVIVGRHYVGVYWLASERREATLRRRNSREERVQRRKHERVELDKIYIEKRGKG